MEAGVKTVVEPDTALAKLSTVAAVTAELAVELAAERVARKAMTKALMICIRYADSSADTEQAHAALALAAKLP
jgi:hypothetical protein